MNILNPQILLEIVFGTIIFLHIAKKNFGASLAYGFQSLAITALFFKFFLETGSMAVFFIALLLFIVKVIIAPRYFIRLMDKHALVFSASTYLNTPLTLIVIAVLTFVAYSSKFIPLSNLVPANQSLLLLALSSMFVSLFLIINRKGVLSQIIGVLSFENSVVAFAFFAKLEQSPMFQVGIIFDLFVWLVIATVFISMIYKHFGTLDTTLMKNLKD